MADHSCDPYCKQIHDSRELLVSDIGEVEAIDVSDVPIPVGYVGHNDQVHQGRQQLVSSNCLHGAIRRAGSEGGDGVAEAIELLKGCGELVQLGEDSTGFGKEQSGEVNIMDYRINTE